MAFGTPQLSTQVSSSIISLQRSRKDESGSQPQQMRAPNHNNEPVRMFLPPENPGKILSSYRCPIAFHQRSVPGAVVGLSVSNLRTQKRLGRTQRSAFQRDRHCHSHPQPRSGSPCGGVLNLIGFRDPGKVHLPEGWAMPCGSNYGRA